MSSASRKNLDWGERLVFGEDGEPLSPEARKLGGLGPLAPPRGKRWVDVLDVKLDYRAFFRPSSVATRSATTSTTPSAPPPELRAAKHGDDDGHLRPPSGGPAEGGVGGQRSRAMLR